MQMRFRSSYKPLSLTFAYPAIVGERLGHRTPLAFPV